MSDEERSILDDPAVVAELEDWAAIPAREAPSNDAGFQSAVDDLDRGLASESSPSARPGVPRTAIRTRARFDDAPEDDAAGVAISTPTAAWSPFYVALWILLMSIGAAAAALVFHGRISQLILQWK